MNCPKCETASLKPATVRTVEVDRCSMCSGIWFDDTELSVLLGLNPSDLRPLDAGKENELLNRKQGQCPRDNSALLRVYSADNRAVVIDTCLRCRGIWLDGGELPKLTSG